MVDYIKIANDFRMLSTDYLKVALVFSIPIGFIVGIIMTYVSYLDTKEVSTKGIYRGIASLFAFILSSAIGVGFFTVAIYSLINAPKSELMHDGGLSNLESIASENGVSNIENLKYNIDYLNDTYWSVIKIIPVENKSRYSYELYLSYNSIKDISSSDYINSVLNKYYLGIELTDQLSLAVDKSKLAYDNVYKELRQ